MSVTEIETVKPAPSKLKYKHAIMLAKMIQPYIRDFQEVRQEIRPASDDESDESDVNTRAQEVGFRMFERLLVKATDDVTEFLASVMNLSHDEVGEIDLDDLLTWFEETWELNNVPGFIERVQGLTTKFSGSKLENLSNASTVGTTDKSKK